jgi:azurin
MMAVRVYDAGGTGGFHGEPDSMRVVESDGTRHNLAGDWHYKIERRINTTIDYESSGELAAHFAFNYGTPEDQAGHGSDIAAPTGGAERGAATPTAPRPTPARPQPVQSLELRAVRQKIAFDKTELRAKAGTLIEVTFVNDDLLQHNVVIGKPGTLNAIGEAADELARSPQGAARSYVPATSAVLVSTKLIDPGGSVTFQFQVPNTAGEYPFVCTFPGHWRLMQGVLVVE